MSERTTIEGPTNGVEIYDNGDRAVLEVDGVEVWEDWCHEPEDVCLSRDLRAFVVEIKRLAAERASLRIKLAAAQEAARASIAECPLGCTADCYCGRCEPLLDTLLDKVGER